MAGPAEGAMRGGSRPVRSLMIAPAMPAETGNGLAMRLGVFLAALRRLGPVDLVVLPVAGPEDAPATLPDMLDVATTVIAVAGRQDTAFQIISRLRDPRQRLDAFRHYGRSSMAAHLSVAVRADVAAAIAGRHYDLVHVGRAYLAEALPTLAGQPLRSIDVDENDADALLRLAALRRRAGGGDAALFLSAEAEAHARAMRTHLPGFDIHFACSAAEARSLTPILGGRNARVAVNAAAPPDRRGHGDDGRTLVFIGTLGFAPNVEGLDWFARRVWPQVRTKARRMPRFLIAGSGHHPALERLDRCPGIRVLGAIPRTGPLYARATAAIAPLQAGGGTRIKIIEAALAGVPVIATPFAATGLPLTDGADIWLAESAPAFAEAVLHALSDPAERNRRARRAARRLEDGYRRADVVRRLSCQMAELLTNGVPDAANCGEDTTWT